MNAKMRHKRILGGSVKAFLGKANDFLKKTKRLSTVGNVLNNTVVPPMYTGITYIESYRFRKNSWVWEKENKIYSN